MRHRVGEWTLKELLVGYPRGERVICEVMQQLGKSCMKSFDLRIERWETRRRELASTKHRPRISDETCHVPYKLMRSSHLGARIEFRIVRRRVAQRFLSPVSQSCEEMLKKTA